MGVMVMMKGKRGAEVREERRRGKAEWRREKRIWWRGGGGVRMMKNESCHKTGSLIGSSVMQPQTHTGRLYAVKTLDLMQTMFVLF